MRKGNDREGRGGSGFVVQKKFMTHEFNYEFHGGDRKEPFLLFHYLTLLSPDERLSLAVRLKLVIARATQDDLAKVVERSLDEKLDGGVVVLQMPRPDRVTAAIEPFDARADARRHPNSELIPCAVAAGWTDPAPLIDALRV